MIQDIKNTLKQSAIYGLSRISTKLIAFILLPLLTLNFTVSEYGIYVLTESLWQILWAVFLFGFESGVIRWYLEITDNTRKKRFLFSVSLFLLIFNLVLVCIIYAFSLPISLVVFDKTGYSNLIVFSSLIAVVETFSFIVFLLLRIEEKAKAYSILAVLSTLISLLLQIYFLQYTSYKLEGVFAAKIIAPLAILMILLPYFIKHIKIGFESELLKGLLKYSFPIMTASLVITLLNQVSRYILGNLTNLDDVGIFGLASNISGLINFLIVSPFTLAFAVLSWKKLSDSNAKRFFTKTTTYLFFGVIFISLIIVLFTPNLIKIFTLRTEYWIASKYVPWIILSMPFYGIHFIGVFSFYVTKKTKYVFYSYTIALIVNVALNFLLIPAFGIYGASIANVISFVVLVVIIYIYSKQNYFFEYEWSKIFTMLVCYLVLVFPFFYFEISNLVLQLIMKFTAVLLFPLLLYVFKFFEEVEVKNIKGFVNKYLIKLKY